MDAQLGQLCVFFPSCLPIANVRSFSELRQTDHTHATVSPVYLWIRCVRIAAPTRDRTVFLHGMCVSSLDLGAVRKRVAQAGQRFNLGSLRVFGNQSSPPIGVIVGDFAAKFIRPETRSVFLVSHRDSICRPSGMLKSLRYFIDLLRNWDNDRHEKHVCVVSPEAMEFNTRVHFHISWITMCDAEETRLSNSLLNS